MEFSVLSEGINHIEDWQDIFETGKEKSTVFSLLF